MIIYKCNYCNKETDNSDIISRTIPGYILKSIKIEEVWIERCCCNKHKNLACDNCKNKTDLACVICNSQMGYIL